MSLLTLAFYIFIAVVAIQVAYYAAFFIGFRKTSKLPKSSNNIPISVIICAKNEAENLKKNISSILGQEYPDFEIVLINDNSSDETLDVMEDIRSRNENIKIVDVKPIEKYWGNKKYALTLGIKAATHDFLLFSDADCRPISKNWIKHMAKSFSNKKAIVLGYGAYEKKSSFLNKLIRFETLLTAIQYFSYANLGMPYMGVGRNLAYRKSLFLNNSGFINHMQITSGDDDLFINEVADKRNTAVCLNPESLTVSKAKKTFNEWIKQKRRHITTAKNYKGKHKLLLSVYYISQLSFWCFSILLLSSLFWWKFVLALITFRLLIQLFAIQLAAKTLNEKDLLYLAPFLEIFLILMQLYIFIANRISKPSHWK